MAEAPGTEVDSSEAGNATSLESRPDAAPDEAAIRDALRRGLIGAGAVRDTTLIRDTPLARFRVRVKYGKTYNYVIFDESKIRITHENGEQVSDIGAVLGSRSRGKKGDASQLELLLSDAIVAANGEPAEIQRENSTTDSGGSVEARFAGLLGRIAQASTEEFEEVLARGKGRVSSIIPERATREVPAWNINGSKIETPEDFAQAVQVLRSPHFESLKVAFADDVVALLGERDRAALELPVYQFPDTPAGRRRLAEEALARLNETATPPTWWQGVVAKLRALLRKWLPGLAWSENDVRALLDGLRQKVGAGEARRSAAFASQPLRDGMTVRDAIAALEPRVSTTALLDVQADGATIRARAAAALRAMPPLVRSSDGKRVSVRPEGRGALQRQAEHFTGGKDSVLVERARAAAVPRVVETLETAPFVTPGDPGRSIYVQRYADIGAHAVVVVNKTGDVADQFVISQFPLSSDSRIQAGRVRRASAGLSPKKQSGGAKGDNPTPPIVEGTTEPPSPPGVNFSAQPADPSGERRGFVESAKAAPSLDASVRARIESIYQPITNAATVAAAKARIDTLGVDRALAEILATGPQNPPTALTNAQGIELLARLQAQGRLDETAALVEHLAAQATTQGQQRLFADAPSAAPDNPAQRQRLELAAGMNRRLVAPALEDQRDLLTGQVEDAKGNALLFGSGAKKPALMPDETRAAQPATGQPSPSGQTGEGIDEMAAATYAVLDDETLAALAGNFADQARAFRDAAREIDRRAGPRASEGTSEARAGADVEGWARENGKLIRPGIIDRLPLVSNQTSEHEVRYREAEDRAVKRTWPGFYGQVPTVGADRLDRRNATPAEYCRRMALQIAVFQSDLRLEGASVSDKPSMIIGQPAGEPSLVISQEWFNAAAAPDAEDIRPAPPRRWFPARAPFLFRLVSTGGWRGHRRCQTRQFHPDARGFGAAGFADGRLYPGDAPPSRTR